MPSYVPDQYFLVLSEHCQHKQARHKERIPTKNVPDCWNSIFILYLCLSQIFITAHCIFFSFFVWIGVRVKRKHIFQGTPSHKFGKTALLNKNWRRGRKINSHISQSENLLFFIRRITFVGGVSKTDLRFVKKITRPYFQAENFTKSA